MSQGSSNSNSIIENDNANLTKIETQVVKEEAKESVPQVTEEPQRRRQKDPLDFKLNLNEILNYRDTRTTIMIRNIPNKYTQKMLLQKINENHKDKYDFFYLPIDFKVFFFGLTICRTSATLVTLSLIL